MNTVVIPISRVRRELNTVMRCLVRGEVDAYLVTRSGREICYIVSYQRFMGWCDRLKQIAADVESKGDE